MRKFTPLAGELCHIFNRGTEKRPIFLNRHDYERFIVSIILFNTESVPLTNLPRYDIDKACLRIPTDPLVKIHAFTLMPNHFHFEMESVTDNGIARFMHRIEMGYSHYFNIYNRRTGNLFQGAYKINFVDNDPYYRYLPLYIHFNPLDLLPTERDWRTKGISDEAKVLRFLKEYPWSSFGEYISPGRFPFITRELIDSLYKDEMAWKRAIKKWSRYSDLFPHL